MSDPEPRRYQRDRADARPVYGSPGHRCDPLRPRRNPGRDRRPSGADAGSAIASGVALARIADRYAATVVVTGRRATVARRIVGIQKLTYIGNHGFELLLPNAPEPRPAPELGALARRGRRYSPARSIRPSWNGPGCGSRTRVRSSPCTGAAPRRARGRGPGRGHRRGPLSASELVAHRGRKVLELRPPISVDKGSATESLLLGTDATAALYAGDDRTDLDAFRALDRLRAAGAWRRR